MSDSLPSFPVEGSEGIVLSHEIAVASKSDMANQR